MNKKTFYINLTKIILALAAVFLFFLPIGMQKINLYDLDSVSEIIYACKLPVSTGHFNFFYCLIYLLPLYSAFIIYSFFNKKITNKIIYFVTLGVLSIYLLLAVICLVSNANTDRWFKTLKFSIYVTLALSFIIHALLSLFGIRYLRHSNSEYNDYKQISKENKNKKIFSIKTKLTATIIGSILLILLTFTLLILKGYKKNITEAVSDIGRSQSEQTAAVYDSAEGEYKKIANFFETQKVSNSYAGSPYDRIDIIIASENVHIYLENIDSSTELPAFDTVAYTTKTLKTIPEEERTISEAQAREYLKRYKNETYRTEPIYNKANGTCKFIYPITLQRQAGSKLVGFSIVTYRQEILMQHYFKTKVMVIFSSIIFLYIAIILSLFLSDYITNPLIFLRTNVHKTSASISDTIKGEIKLSPDSFDFNETINTKDEIKDLSLEIKDLFSLLKGIVPYISLSTLKHAEKETKKSSSRELCFLFTDIRGFTTLCEDKQPKEVVDILNHYLDIETQIILDNDGDIDKFVGDEMMAFFSGPKREYNACKAAMEIRAAMRSEQEKAKKDGKDIISIGIGINTGKVVFGSVGAKNRLDFTSIGDTVNLAARLEGANKAYGSKAIITDAVYSKLKDSFVCRELDYITVKGKTEPVCIYELLQTKSDASEKLFDIKTLFEKGLNFYRKQNWDKAEEFFSQCATNYNDNPSIVFLDRIKHFKNNPPPKKWDGVFVMKVK